MGVVTDKNLELFANELKPSIVRGMTKEAFNNLTEAEKAGMVVLTDVSPDSTPSDAVGNIYSEKEQKIGVWVDGSFVYRRVIFGTTGNANAETFFDALESFRSAVRIDCIVQLGNGTYVPINNIYGYAFVGGLGVPGCMVNQEFLGNRPCTLILEYTKTTDSGVTT